MFEIVSKKQRGGTWFITLKITSPYCGCMLNTRILTFDHEPSEEEIKKQL